MTPTPLALVKVAITYTARAGATKVVSDIIKNNTSPETPQDIAKVYVGSAVIGSIVADAAVAHAEAKVDQIVTFVAEVRAKSNAKS